MYCKTDNDINEYSRYVSKPARNGRNLDTSVGLETNGSRSIRASVTHIFGVNGFSESVPRDSPQEGFLISLV